MKELVEYLAKSLAEHPDQVLVTQRDDEDATVVELKVLPEDMGKVIGKQGRIAKSIRALVKASAGQDEHKRIAVDIMPLDEE